MEKLFINAKREGYAPSQCRDTMTIGELITHLQQYDEDTPVFLKHDNGYTYGSITEWDFEESYDNKEEE